MTGGHPGVIKDHPRAGKAHDLFDAGPHIGAVAVYLAVRAEGLCLHKGASVRPRGGIIQKLAAPGASPHDK